MRTHLQLAAVVIVAVLIATGLGVIINTLWVDHSITRQNNVVLQQIVNAINQGQQKAASPATTTP